MKAVRVITAGPPEAVEIAHNVSLPIRQPGEVLVKQHGSSINPLDYKILTMPSFMVKKPKVSYLWQELLTQFAWGKSFSLEHQYDRHEMLPALEKHLAASAYAWHAASSTTHRVHYQDSYACSCCRYLEAMLLV